MKSIYQDLGEDFLLRAIFVRYFVCPSSVLSALSIIFKFIYFYLFIYLFATHNKIHNKQA